MSVLDGQHPFIQQAESGDTQEKDTWWWWLEKRATLLYRAIFKCVGQCWIQKYYIFFNSLWQITHRFGKLEITVQAIPSIRKVFCFFLRDLFVSSRPHHVILVISQIQTCYFTFKIEKAWTWLSIFPTMCCRKMLVAHSRKIDIWILYSSQLSDSQ